MSNHDETTQLIKEHARQVTKIGDKITRTEAINAYLSSSLDKAKKKVLVNRIIFFAVGALSTLMLWELI